MTMHGAKGLSSKIVFIPGLEKSIIPNSKSERVVGVLSENLPDYYMYQLLVHVQPVSYLMQTKELSMERLLDKPHLVLILL